MTTERFFITNKSGMKLECQIDRDESQKIQPVVFLTGGFGSNAFSGDTQPPVTELFLKLGFAVFRMNFRGIGISEGDLAYSTIAAGLEDMDAGLDYLCATGWGGIT